jgi:hypothetical protein
MVTRFEKRKQLRDRNKKVELKKLTKERVIQRMNSKEYRDKYGTPKVTMEQVFNPVKKKRGGGIKTTSDKEFDAYKKNLKFMKKQQEEKKLREQMNKDKKRLQEKKLGIAVKRGGMAKLPKGLQAYIKKRKKK